MDSLVLIFDKMKSRTRNQIVLIAIGLVMPALIYLTVNFPSKIYEGDLLKIIVMSICINFTAIFILGFYSFLSRLIGYKKHLRFIDKCSEALTRRTESTTLNLGKIRTQLENIKKIEYNAQSDNDNNYVDYLKSIESLEQDAKDLDDEVQLVGKYQNEFKSYIEDILNVYIYASLSSLVYTIYVVFISMYNIIFSMSIEFSVSGIFRNISPFLIVYILGVPLLNGYKSEPKYSYFKEKLKID